MENIYGDNSHHIIESCFKGLARSLRTALEIDPRNKKCSSLYKGIAIKKAMNIAIIDYESGNISSVINSFKTVCRSKY